MAEEPQYSRGRNYSFVLKVGEKSPEDDTDDISMYLESS